MATLTQIILDLPWMPRFDNGMNYIREIIRMMTESITNEIRNIQADIMCEDTDNTRNGYRERMLISSVGAINLHIPKVCIGSYFPKNLLNVITAPIKLPSKRFQR